jgi:hypothetical protein
VTARDAPPHLLHLQFKKQLAEMCNKPTANFRDSVDHCMKLIDDDALDAR